MRNEENLYHLPKLSHLIKGRRKEPVVRVSTFQKKQLSPSPLLFSCRGFSFVTTLPLDVDLLCSHGLVSDVTGRKE
ncbi:hypothetical protein HPP92_002213 [Vanilla planifolia]|uniref:Uncharacterized protein n=1 Tax=Vanilla planifolia TaxID=51239 RepID=A0A835S9B6_VANPL|nr:hypothetical protein HPP92_002213 [Vanilla planifolia]